MIRLLPAATTLVLQPEEQSGCVHAALPQGVAGAWCRLAARVPGRDPWWAKVEITDPGRGQVVREAFLGRPGRRGWRSTLLHVPRTATGLMLRIFPPDQANQAGVSASLRVLGRVQAACGLLWHGRRLVAGALAGDAMGRLGRLRVVLGQAPARAGEAPGYDVWCALFDSWGERERRALEAHAGRAPAIGVLVVGEDEAGRAASLASIEVQWMAPAQTAGPPGPAGPEQDAPWTLVLQAGDRLAPHALACFALAAARNPQSALIYADTDHSGPEGRRSPLFKPGADSRLVRAGLITRGACLVRSLAASGRSDAIEAGSLSLAEVCPADRMHRVPLVLTHVAIPAALPHASEAVSASHPSAEWPFVSIVVATSGRSVHMLRCLRRLLSTTQYPGGFEVLLAVSRIDPDDRTQARRLQRAARLPQVRVLSLGLTNFNYAQVNNRAVQESQGPLVMLLNDDVAPIRPDWLARMVSMLQTDAEIVGARLLYGNGQVQHGGVIMGLGHLCDHAFRLAGSRDPGPHGLATLDREVSAVTGACLLISSALYQKLGGLDESFTIALNDVDFCLRARAAGLRIVFAASVALHHYEGLSLGRHYAGARAHLEIREVRALRRRWSRVIADDPFYNPRASLEPGREFSPGFPPRITPLSWIAGDLPVADLNPGDSDDGAAITHAAGKCLAAPDT